MRQVEPYLLWLGNAGSMRDFGRIYAVGIQAVVQLALEEPPATLPRDLLSFRIPLNDGSGNDQRHIRLAVNAITMLLAAEISTLVCCGAGMSRTPCVVACALAKLQDRDPRSVLSELSQQVKTDVSTSLWHDLLASLD